MLATWRLTSLLVQEDGPARLFARLRAFSTFGGVLECVWCCSVWVAGALLILERFWRWPVDVLAVSAGAIWYDKHTST